MKKLMDRLGFTEAQVKEILLERNRVKPKILPRYISDKKIKFGIVSDTHLGSRKEMLNELHTFYAICKKSGVNTIFHCGDILDGNGRMYRGQLSEIHTYGAMAQAKYVVKNYPKVEGIKTYFINGNHDLSFYNENGIDIGEIIASKRQDMIYLGHYTGDVTLDKVIVRMIHPDGGGA